MTGIDGGLAPFANFDEQPDRIVDDDDDDLAEEEGGCWGKVGVGVGNEDVMSLLWSELERE